jgi:chromate transporter
MAVVTYTLGQAAIIDGFAMIICLLSTIAILQFKVNPIWLILAGGGVGIAVKVMGQ